MSPSPTFKSGIAHKDGSQSIPCLSLVHFPSELCRAKEAYCHRLECPDRGPLRGLVVGPLWQTCFPFQPAFIAFQAWNFLLLPTSDYPDFLS